MFSLQGKRGVDGGAVLSDRAFVLRFFGHEADRLLIVNLGADLHFAPSRSRCWRRRGDRTGGCCSLTENPHYGGGGRREAILDDGWRIAAEKRHRLRVTSRRRSEHPHEENHGEH